MASVSISHLILFIASLIVAAGVAGTLTAGVDRVGAAIDDESLDVSQQLRTDIEVISDSGSSVHSNATGNVTLYVKNTGSLNLPPDGTGLDVLVDGSYVVDTTVTPLDGSWNTGDVIVLEANVGSLAPGDHRAKLVIGGDEEVFTFRT